MTKISSLKNMGPVSQAMLESVGLKTKGDIAKVGAVEAFIQLKLFGYHVTNNMLWALHGALNDVDLRHIDDKTKKELLKQVDEESS